MATLSGNKIKNTYQSLVKFSDNGNITVGAKQLTDGFGNNSPMFVSTTQIGIGVTPEVGLNLHVYGDAKIGSNLTVIGNLVVEGSTTTVGTDTLTVKDPLIVLANNNTSTDAVDIGFYGKYHPSSTTLYSGLFREALTGKYRLFKDLQTEPTTTVNTSGTGYAKADLVIGNLEATQVDLGDDDKIRLGNSQDLEIFHDSAIDTSFIQINGNLDIRANTLSLKSYVGETMLRGSSNGAVRLYYDGVEKFITTSTGISITDDIIVSGTVDGRDIATDGTKLDGIESGATADQTAAEIKTAYESNSNTNAFTDADETKLDGIEAGADVTDATNVLAAGAVMTTGNQSISGVKTFSDQVTIPATPSASTDAASKGYVDTKVGENNELSEVLANGNTTGGTDIVVSTSDQIFLPNGSASNPSIAFSSNTNTGIYTNSSSIYFSVNGSEKAYIGDSQITLQENLVVYDSISASSYIMIEGGTNPYLQIQDTTNEEYLNLYSSDNESAIVYTQDTFKISSGIDFLNQTPRLTIDSSGNSTFTGDVGIGVTGTPSTKLHLGGTAPMDSIIRQDSTASGTNWEIGERSAGKYQIWEDDTDSVVATFMSSGNVGIGTDSPSTRTEIKETNNDIYQLTLYNSHLSTTSKARIGNWYNDIKISSNFMQSGGTKTQDDASLSSWVIAMGADSSDSFNISRSPAGSTTLSSLMKIDSSGNVGIGTTLPDAKLQVEGNVKVGSASGASWTDAKDDIGGLDVFVGSGSYALQLWDDNDQTNPRFVVERAGNVGIGTDSPNTKLEISGNASTRNALSNVLTLNGGGTVANPYDGFGVGTVFKGLDYSNASRDYAYIYAVIENQTSSSTPAGDPGFKSQLRFYTNTGGASSTLPTEKMRIDSSGVISIGPSTTSSEIYFNYNNTNNKGGLKIDYSTAELRLSAGESGNSYHQAFYTNGLERMRIDSSGAVGIKATSLSVISGASGTLNLGSTSSNLSGGILYQSNGTTVAYHYYESGNFLYQNAGAYGHIFLTGNTTERLRIDSSGKIQVGSDKVIWAGGYGGGLVIRRNNATSDRLIKMVTVDSTGAIVTDNVLVAKGASVGIGTDSPNAKLQVNGHIRAENSSFLAGREDASAPAHSFHDDADTGMFNVNSNILGFSTAGTERLRIDSSGNVGIGTTSPEAKLDISSVAGGTYALEISTPERNRALFFYNSASTSDAGYLGIKRGSVDALNHRLATSGNSAFCIGVGNVGIGNDSPQGKLHIGESATIGSNFTTAVNNSQLFVHNVGANTNSNVIFAGGDTGSTGGTGAYSFGQNGLGYTHWIFYHKPISTNQSSVGSISSTSTATSYNTSSDYRLKENVVEMTGALNRVSQLKPSRFNFIADVDKTVDGFLAHEVQDIVPEAITGEKDAIDEDSNPIYQGIDQSKLVPLLVGAIQELKAEIELLKTQINK